MSLQVELSPLIDPVLEHREPDEIDSIRTSIRQIEEGMRTRYFGKEMRRDAHPKGHGIVRAEFIVEDVPADLRYGIFAEPGRYKSWVRFSNGATDVQSDAAIDGRGMAIKVCGVEGERASSLESLEKNTQDFVMIDHPVFFIRNASEYVDFTAAEKKGDTVPFFLWPPERWHLLWVALKLKRTVASLLENTYFSMSPYKLGPHAMKFRARAQGDWKRQKGPKGPSNYLLDDLKKRLAKQEVRFDFEVQLRTHPRKMAIEDASQEWSEKLSPYRKVATVVIPKQEFDGDSQRRFMEDVSYNSWHALKAHAPLGGLNRMRLEVYRAINALRHRVNGTEICEPKGDEEF